mgnify:CR=1 FL=1
MRIGIDVSQLAFKESGVANYLSSLLRAMLEVDKKNEYIFFFSSMRRNLDFSLFNVQSNPKIIIKTFKIPPTFLSFIWNDLHFFPIEWFIGPVDLFITSDWTEPPVKNAKKATIIYDLTIYKTPNETDKKIVESQKRKLHWVKKESDIVFTISESSKKDIIEILGLPSSKIKVIYPGL